MKKLKIKKKKDLFDDLKKFNLTFFLDSEEYSFKKKELRDKLESY